MDSSQNKIHKGKNSNKNWQNKIKKKALKKYCGMTDKNRGKIWQFCGVNESKI